MMNQRRLKEDLKTTIERITTLKRVLRATWTRPMADEQREHHHLRRRATELCVLRASVRAKLHLRAIPRWVGAAAEADFAAWHAKLVARVAKDYESDGPIAQEAR